MGKFMRKAKITADIAVMEVSPSTFGVQTRAKTLALQRLQTATTLPSTDSSSSYLELRSRRLEKSPMLNGAKKDHHKQSTGEESCRQDRNCSPKTSSRSRLSSLNSRSVESFLISCSEKEAELHGSATAMTCQKQETEDSSDWGAEASFGENNLDFEGRERYNRESTPSSLIRDLDATSGTPGSATRPTASTIAGPRAGNEMQRNLPTTHEMEEFFALAEQEQQRHFAEKYNFDVVNDLPMPGRYDWVRMDL